MDSFLFFPTRIQTSTATQSPQSVFGVFGRGQTVKGEGTDKKELVIGMVIFFLTMIPFYQGKTSGSDFEYSLVMTIFYASIALFMYIYFRRVQRAGRITALDRLENLTGPLSFLLKALYYYLVSPIKFLCQLFYLMEKSSSYFTGFEDPGTIDFYQNTLSSTKSRLTPDIGTAELLRILFIGPAYAKRRTIFSENPIERTYSGFINREVLLSTVILAICTSIPVVITAARGENIREGYIKYSYPTIAVVSFLIFILVYGTLRGYSTDILKAADRVLQQKYRGETSTVSDLRRYDEIQEEMNRLVDEADRIDNSDLTDREKLLRIAPINREVAKLADERGVLRFTNDLSEVNRGLEVEDFTSS